MREGRPSRVVSFPDPPRLGMRLLPVLVCLGQAVRDCMYPSPLDAKPVHSAPIILHLPLNVLNVPLFAGSETSSKVS